MPRLELALPAGPRPGWGPSPARGGGHRVPVSEEIVVVVGAEAALGALLLPVDAGGVDEGSEHGRGRQPGWRGERMESSADPEEVLCLPRLQQTPSLIQGWTLTQQSH